jgi:hypothetical protein
MSDPEIVSAKLDLLYERVQGVEATLGKVAEAMVAIARIEERTQANNAGLDRAFGEIERLAGLLEKHIQACDARFKPLEETQPVSKLISGWVSAWAAGLVGVLGGAIITKVFGG